VILLPDFGITPLVRNWAIQFELVNRLFDPGLCSG
jgi:hypothetical protein